MQDFFFFFFLKGINAAFVFSMMVMLRMVSCIQINDDETAFFLALSLVFFLEEKSIYTTGSELGDECVPWCPITHTLLFEILCYADKSSRGSNHLSVFHQRDVHIPPLISEFIVFITNPKMGSSCNTRHLIILSTPRAC